MFRRLFALIVAILLPLLIVAVLFSVRQVTAGGPTVLIDAVLYDSYETSDADEAVRIRNVSGQGVDISGWQLNDGESATAVIPAGVILAPGQAIWLARYGAAFQRQFGFPPDLELNDTLPAVPNLTGAWPNLANTGDQVMLRDAANTLVDCLAFESNPNEQCGAAWSGAAVYPYTPNTSFGAEGQILYRARDLQTGQPLPDTNSAADWAQTNSDVNDGRKVQYPGWDLDEFFWTMQVTETAVLTIAIAPDNAYEVIVDQIARAQTSIQIESHTFESVALAETLLAARQRGVAVTLLMEGEPPGGISDQQRYICQLLADAGADCWFMFNESSQRIFDRYTYIHAKFILIDGDRVIISSENLSPRSLPDDDKSDGTWGRRGVVLITDAPGVVSHVQTIFNRDFDPAAHVDITGTHLIGAPPPGFVPVTVTGGITYPVRFAAPTAVQGTFAFELVQSPENSLRRHEALLGMVNRAGAGDVVLVQQLDERPFWGSSLSNPVADPNPRLEAYIAAARRGALVRLLLDSFFDSSNSPVSNSATCTYVNNLAIVESLDMACKTGNPTGLGIHNKMVLVLANGRGYIHVGSLNGSELSSKGNRELALQVQSDAAYALLANMFWGDWGYQLYMPILMRDYIAPARYVLISEVLYDPAGAQDDDEFIELVNPSTQSIDLSNYSLGDAVNPTDFEDVRRFPPGTLLAPGQTLVVATTATAFFSEYGFNPDFEILATDPLVPDMIDDPTWGDPSTFLRLGNSGDEVILRDPNDLVVDAIAYGTGFFPGIVSCNLVSVSNASLERYPYWIDRDNCLVDFREWPFPNPGSLP